jgi:CRISPR-associated protein (TIGR03986 family)
MAFHNPYHFVPVKAGGRVGDLKRADFPVTQGHPTHKHVTHDRYCADTFSGRLICRITTEDPIFVGDTALEGQSDGAKKLEHFELSDGKPAIPASTLRGLISSLAEAASNSALRVLEDGSYSYRKTVAEPLTKIGRVVLDAGSYSLQPLPGVVKLVLNRFNLGTIDGTAFYYLKTRLDSAGRTQPVDLKSKSQFDAVAQNDKASYQRGFLRVMGEGRTMPPGRRHELFVPYPIEVEGDSQARLEIPKFVVDRFEDLAAQRTEDDPSLPYHPIGTPRNSVVGKDEFQVKTGDLVYYETTPDASVSEIALSSIWRGRVETHKNGLPANASTFSFFSAVDKELLPFNPGREVITIAEQLFGFVEQGKGESSSALSGRVRFSHAILEGFTNNEGTAWIDENRGLEQPYQSETTLKILSSPKPPSPSMYFKMKNGSGGYIPKAALSPETHQTQGRKYYLHKRKGEPWRSQHPRDDVKQKVRICPVKPNAVFYFHVDFNNLSEVELALLLYALRPYDPTDQQPLADFRHKIGMGKPLGLGKIRIELLGLLGVDRRVRYSSDGFFKERYSQKWFAADEAASNWPGKYRQEKAAAASGSITAALNLQTICSKFTPNADIHRAIELIGNPNKLRAEVHTPTIRNQDKEKETFQWFVQNDKAPRNRKQFLDPINASTAEIETLEEF